MCRRIRRPDTGDPAGCWEAGLCCAGFECPLPPPDVVLESTVKVFRVFYAFEVTEQIYHLGRLFRSGDGAAGTGCRITRFDRTSGTDDLSALICNNGHLHGRLPRLALDDG